MIGGCSGNTTWLPSGLEHYLPRQVEHPRERKGDIRVISDFIAGDVPIRDKAIVGVGERCVVGHGRSTSVGVFAPRKNLVDGIHSV